MTESLVPQCCSSAIEDKHISPSGMKDRSTLYTLFLHMPFKITFPILMHSTKHSSVLKMTLDLSFWHNWETLNKLYFKLSTKLKLSTLTWFEILAQAHRFLLFLYYRRLPFFRCVAEASYISPWFLSYVLRNHYQCTRDWSLLPPWIEKLVFKTGKLGLTRFRYSCRSNNNRLINNRRRIR